MENAMPNSLDRPLYKEAVYGIRNINVMTDAAIFNELLPNLFSKKSGMVLEFKCCVITLVRRPRTTHAIRDPNMALPMPAHVEAIPYFHPN